MAEAWKKLREKCKGKRTKTSWYEAPRRPKGEEVIVQRVSSQVTGKAQKYSRVGPREFVPFPNDREFTIEAIKDACEIHFKPQIGKGYVCDVLAGQQGPSCVSIGQLPDLKVIHVRFIHDTSSTASLSSFSPMASPPGHTAPNRLTISDQGYGDHVHKKRKIEYDSDSCRPQFRFGDKSVKKAASFISVGDSAQSYPLSLSVSDMMRLGQINRSATTTTVVNIYNFDMENVVWSKVPVTVEFMEHKNKFGSGGFRSAFKATSKHKDFMGMDWVIKRYLPTAVDCIRSTGQTLSEHTKKIVQMHALARNFSQQLECQIKENSVCELFGEIPKYRNIYYGETDQQDCVTIEEFIPGIFSKYINNTGLVCADLTDATCKKAECLAHFSYHKSEKKLMLVDIQGNGTNLFDPEIASAELQDEE